MKIQKSVPLFLLVIMLDRVTKYWAYHFLGNGFTVSSFLSFNLTFNRGVAWGLFNVPDETVFLSVSCLVSVLFCAFALFSYTRLHTTLEIVGSALVLSGGISNIIDRFIYQGVIDFIIFSAGSWSWPAFNIADAAIVGGVMLIGYAWLIE